MLLKRFLHCRQAGMNPSSGKPALILPTGNWQSGGLIEVLKQDPLFPQRLQNDLQEVIALWFYSQGIYDSAAVHLEKTLHSSDIDRQEQSRREYLIAQLYERSHRSKDAQGFYQRAFEHTYDPVMEVYGRLNFIQAEQGKRR